MQKRPTSTPEILICAGQVWLQPGAAVYVSTLYGCVAMVNKQVWTLWTMWTGSRLQPHSSVFVDILHNCDESVFLM